MLWVKLCLPLIFAVFATSGPALPRGSRNVNEDDIDLLEKILLRLVIDKQTRVESDVIDEPDTRGKKASGSHGSGSHEDPCRSNPCRNGGTCTSSYDSRSKESRGKTKSKGSGEYTYTCACRKGYTGKYCEVVIATTTQRATTRPTTTTTTTRPTTTTTRSTTTTTRPLTSTTTTTTTTVPYNPCNTNPCYNGGYCYGTSTGYGCECEAGYKGYRCENPPVSDTTVNIEVQVDNSFTLYVDGVQSISGTDWPTIYKTIAPRSVRLLAVDARDYGVLFGIRVNSSVISTASLNGWKCINAAKVSNMDWVQTQYDDNSWPTAKYSEAKFPNAIWAVDAGVNNRVYCRGRTDPCDVDTQEVIVCENTAKQLIKCDSDLQYLHVVSANYGRTITAAQICPYYTTHKDSTACFASNSNQVVSDWCEGQSQCSLQSSNEVFGDPCPGTYKYLHVQYQCLAHTCFNNNGGYDCLKNSPCAPVNTAVNGYYYAATNPQQFIQCDAFGGCFVMNCGPGTVWNDEYKTCAHA